MMTARHIVTLLKSHIAGDEDRFLATAMQLAAHEARQGHGKLAQELKELVDDAGAILLSSRLSETAAALLRQGGNRIRIAEAHRAYLKDHRARFDAAVG